MNFFAMDDIATDTLDFGPQGKLAFRRFSNPTSAQVCHECLTGKSYPFIPEIGPVRVIADVGANVGAAAIYFAMHYTEATIHAYEPSSRSLPLLIENAQQLNNIRVHKYGLGGKDDTRTIHHSNTQDSVTDSLVWNDWSSNTTNEVVIKAARETLTKILPIDILKIDTEGCEVEILESLAETIADIKVIYIEYHDWADRIQIDKFLSPTHILMIANPKWKCTGELVYLQKSIALTWDIA